ncbi:MAG: NAD(P)-dependent oxidoreductase [Armatimonadetes bacterium]|nr:NAD(P)-dependent oxidoreductase [Armatimonadota bacterium]MCX7967408.1 NAD(P)-dependent oxidoreductase [Armatimonadota bacterium]MDW8142640.1 NAD(P)-dependent oxidoreductase [Armatimonadota bacterium]
MSILVTGACGFIGAWVVKNLCEKNMPVILTDLKRNGTRLSALVPNWQSLPFVEGDITEPEFLLEVARQFEIERIIHLAAWQIPLCRQDPIRGATVNVIGTLRVFETAKQLRNQIKRIVYASSVAVFGPAEMYGRTPVHENVPLKPVTHYGAFKVCNELCANAYWHENGIPSAGLRPHTVYGFGRDVGVTADITTALKAIALNQPFRIRFGGFVDLQYAADVAEAFVKCALTDLDGARVYNLRGTPMSVQETIKVMAEIEPEAAELITFEPTPLPLVWELDDSAIQRDVGPIKVTPVKSGFAETLGIFKRLRDLGQLSLA